MSLAPTTTTTVVAPWYDETEAVSLARPSFSVRSVALAGSPTARSGRLIFVPCDHEYLNFRGGKFSKSRGAAVDMPYYLSKYDPDPLRFYLTATAPETRDTEFSWEDFVERNNNELVATWGNLANRMLSFAYKRFDGQVPEPGELDDEDGALLERVEAGFETVGWMPMKDPYFCAKWSIWPWPGSLSLKDVWLKQPSCCSACSIQQKRGDILVERSSS
jgi:hypothetical protein